MAAGPGGAAGTARNWGTWSSCWGSAHCWPAAPATSPVASASASPSGGRCSPPLACSSWTSPLASLDEPRKAEILPYLDRLRAESRIPIVYVSHAIDEVARLAQTMVLLSEGRVAAVGPTALIMARLDLGPATGRAEAGALLEGTVTGHDLAYDLTEVEIAGQPVLVPRFQAAPATM